MIIRVLEDCDEEELRKIHAQFYSKEFDFPNFRKHYLCVFVVTNDAGDIITAGGIRSILECVTLTDKSFPVRTRAQALLSLLQGCVFVAQNSHYNEIHAFIQEEILTKHWARVGFKPTVGKSLVLPIGESNG